MIVGRVLVPLPDRDFDVTEVAVPWRLLTDAGHEVVFATERGGRPPAADPKLLTGVLFGQLGAGPEPVEFYRDLTGNAAYRTPLPWAELKPGEFDALLLPGGHAPGMRQYLGSDVLHRTVTEFWALDRPVGAICHGPVVLARTVDPTTGVSVLSGRTSTCLPKYLERTAYYLTAWRLGRYYRTYPAYVQDEVTAALGPAGRFVRGPRSTRRDTRENSAPAFVVRDGNYLSARWPGDAYTFAARFAEGLAGNW
ncbi:type 1 glutamine amidotransferase domain-containing protein [Kibdelosporangium lantanae]